MTISTPQISETRFRLLAAKGNRKRGLEILQKLDAHFKRGENQTLHEDSEPFKT